MSFQMKPTWFALITDARRPAVLSAIKVPVMEGAAEQAGPGVASALLGSSLQSSLHLCILLFVL